MYKKCVAFSLAVALLLTSVPLETYASENADIAQEQTADAVLDTEETVSAEEVISTEETVSIEETISTEETASVPATEAAEPTEETEAAEPTQATESTQETESTEVVEQPEESELNMDIVNYDPTEDEANLHYLSAAAATASASSVTYDMLVEQCPQYLNDEMFEKQILGRMIGYGEQAASTIEDISGAEFYHKLSQGITYPIKSFIL